MRKLPKMNRQHKQISPMNNMKKMKDARKMIETWHGNNEPLCAVVRDESDGSDNNC